MPTINLKIKIDNKDAVASIQLTDSNIKKLVGSVNKISQSSKTQTKQLVQGFDDVRIAIGGIQQVVGVIRNSFGKTLQLYGMQEKAETQLATALGYRSQALLDYATAQQKVTTHGDEEIIQAQSLIAAFTKDENAIKQLTKASLDLADAKGMSLVLQQPIYSLKLAVFKNIK